MDDLDLLRDYSANHSDAAFRSLIERYVNLVYSAARRQTQTAHLAEEVAQAVFLILARKASSLPSDIVLSGWLVRTTRFVALNALRREQTRRHYEKEAMIALQHSTSENLWETISPLLDEALVGLGEKDRDAVVLRFFEQKSFREVGQALGTSEDNAQKRVSRALEKLRAFFARRGHSTTAVLLTTALTTNALQAAPAGFAFSVVQAAVFKGGASTMLGEALCNSTLRLMQRLRLQVMALRTATAVLLVAGAFMALRHAGSESSATRNTIAAVAGALSEAAQPAAEPTVAAATIGLQPGERRFAFRVLDATNENPLAGVRLTVKEIADYPNQTTRDYFTDRNGFGLLLPAGANQKNWGYRIEVFRDGYVPKYVSWSASQGDVFSEFPSEYTTKLERAVTIGGYVVNESNEPVSGARVVFSVSGSSPGASKDRERLTMMGNYHQETTDEHGRWSCNHVPEKFGMITWSLIHREYQEVTYGTTAPEADDSVGRNRISKTDYLGGSAVMRMLRGLIVAGTVAQEESAQPIPNAKVGLGRSFGKPEANLITDERGRFRFQNARSNETHLTVQANGFAPLDMRVTPQTDVTEHRVVLNRGGVLRGRVLDPSGQPVTNATINVAPDERNYRTFEWRARTDVEGRFDWQTAPRGTNEYQVSASDYESTSVSLPTDGAEHIITLGNNTRRRLQVIARAIDADTKVPLESFKLATAESQDPLTNNSAVVALSFSRARPKGTSREGVCAVTLSSYTTFFIMEVQAEGYMPSRLTNQNSGQGELTLNFELKKGTPIRGTVRSIEGEPVADVQIYHLAEHDYIQMVLPAQFQAERMPIAGRAKTDAKGEFVLGPQIGRQTIIASHPSGFAEIPVDSWQPSEPIVLQPWGRIEGVFKLGSQPAAHETIALFNMFWRFREPTMMLHMKTKTDAQGRFVFEGVPPGVRKVFHQPKQREGRLGRESVNQDVAVFVKPRETTQVSLGGSGRTVLGRVSTQGMENQIDWLQDFHRLELLVPLPDEAVIPSTADFPHRPDYTAARGSWAKRSRPFWLSEAGKEAQRSQRTHMLLFKADGTFQVNDVPPGTYELILEPTAPPAAQKLPGGATSYVRVGTTPIGSLQMKVTIPEGCGWEPFDLGVLPLKASPPRTEP